MSKGKGDGPAKIYRSAAQPSSIDDSVAEAKVKGLDIFNMSTAELFAKYPNPGACSGSSMAASRPQAKNSKSGDKTSPAKTTPARSSRQDQERSKGAANKILGKLYANTT